MSAADKFSAMLPKGTQFAGGREGSSPDNKQPVPAPAAGARMRKRQQQPDAGARKAYAAPVAAILSALGLAGLLRAPRVPGRAGRGRRERPLRGRKTVAAGCFRRVVGGWLCAALPRREILPAERRKRDGFLAGGCHFLGDAFLPTAGRQPSGGPQGFLRVWSRDEESAHRAGGHRCRGREPGGMAS